jgi:hypothetical protein
MRAFIAQSVADVITADSRHRMAKVPRETSPRAPKSRVIFAPVLRHLSGGRIELAPKPN